MLGPVPSPSLLDEGHTPVLWPVPSVTVTPMRTRRSAPSAGSAQADSALSALNTSAPPGHFPEGPAPKATGPLQQSVQLHFHHN